MFDDVFILKFTVDICKLGSLIFFKPLSLTHLLGNCCLNHTLGVFSLSPIEFFKYLVHPFILPKGGWDLRSQMCDMPVCVNKILLEHRHSHSFVSPAFITAEVSNRERERTAARSKNIYCLVLCRKTCSHLLCISVVYTSIPTSWHVGYLRRRIR